MRPPYPSGYGGRFSSLQRTKAKAGFCLQQNPAFGAGDVTRTRDLLITSEMHYRLCYTSMLRLLQNRITIPQHDSFVKNKLSPFFAKPPHDNCSYCCNFACKISHLTRIIHRFRQAKSLATPSTRIRQNSLHFAKCTQNIPLFSSLLHLVNSLLLFT